jgi:hypothetical protein
VNQLGGNLAGFELKRRDFYENPEKLFLFIIIFDCGNSNLNVLAHKVEI